MKRIVFLIAFTFLTCHQQSPIQWQWTLKGRSYAEPKLDGSTLYVVSQAGELIAGNVADGTKKWSINLKSPIISGPEVFENVLVVATQTGNIYAVNKNSGATIWKILIGEGVEAPLAIQEQMIFVPTAAGNLHSLSLKDGKILWTSRGHGKFNSKPVVQTPYLFIGDWNGNLLSIKLDGSLNWSFKTAGRITEAVVLFRNVVYAATHDDYIYALEAPSGRLLWSFKASYPSNLLYLQNELFFGDLKGKLFSLNPSSGKLTGEFPLDRKPIQRIYGCDGKAAIVTGNVIRFDPHEKKSEVLFSSKPPAYKVACGKKQLIIVNKVYGVSAFSIVSQ